MLLVSKPGYRFASPESLTVNDSWHYSYPSCKNISGVFLISQRACWINCRRPFYHIWENLPLFCELSDWGDYWIISVLFAEIVFFGKKVWYACVGLWICCFPSGWVRSEVHSPQARIWRNSTLDDPPPPPLMLAGILQCPCDSHKDGGSVNKFCSALILNMRNSEKYAD